MYEKLVAAGSVDERTALMLFLLVEKLRGEVSQANPHTPGKQSTFAIGLTTFCPATVL